ncbi:MAG: imidazole glycerol phosphate synthase subunit HisH [Pirellula sp.]
MGVTVGIVDYQMGNLRSVQKAIEHIGHPALISGDRSELSQVSHLILPGVGAFQDAVAELKRRGLIELLVDWASSGKPFLGICLGMQLLFETSDEGGQHEGLGILKGRVRRFKTLPHEPAIKIPHMGWNKVASTCSPDPMLEGIANLPYFYFVHSYYAEPTDPKVVWLQADYGQRFCAAVRSGNVLATQFHPEKSQRDGLQLLSNFLKLSSSN